MKRGVALLGAVIMIVASLLIRARLDDNGSSSTGSTHSSGGQTTIVCITELADACHTAYGSNVTIEDATTTAKRLASGGSNIDAWVTFSGWPDLLAADNVSPALDVKPVASTPLVIAAVKERAARLACAPTGWKCWLDAAGNPWSSVGGDSAWGNVAVGIPPYSSGTGLLVQGSAATAYYGSTGVATNDPEYTASQAALGKAMQDVNSLFYFISQLPARYSAIGALQADVVAQQGAKADLIQIYPLTPPAFATAVIAHVGGGASVDSSKLAKLLTTAGWTAPVDSSGMPEGGVLLALSGI